MLWCTNQADQTRGPRMQWP